jgi:hypothetical protein
VVGEHLRIGELALGLGEGPLDLLDESLHARRVGGPAPRGLTP